MSEFIISQIFGGVALILICLGYFLKSKQNFLIIQIVANLFYAGSFIIQSALVGGIITLVSIIRCIYLAICNKTNFKYTVYYLPIFIACYITIGVLFFDGFADIMPIVTATIFTIAFYVKDLQHTRYLCLLPNILLVAYNILCRTYTNALVDLIEVGVLLVAIVKFAKERKMQNKEINNENTIK